MASRCGCNMVCACAVTAGTNVTVTGNGTPASPYVVNAEAEVAAVALDTPTVDTTVTGAGSEANPFIISSAVKISTAPNNCATADATGVFVPCADGSETIVQAGANITVTGTGTIADPYIVVAGDPGTPSITTVQDSPCIDLTLTGTGAPGDPYVLSAVPIIAPEPNGVECGPTGLAVIPSADAGNSLTIGGDGRLFAPPGGAGTPLAVTDTQSVNLTVDPAAPQTLSADVIVDPAGPVKIGPAGLTVDPGCGLEVVGGEIQANVSTWIFPCDIDIAGGDIYCSPTSGNLKGPPARVQNAYQSTMVDNTTVTIGAGQTQCVATQSQVFADPCYATTGVLLDRGAAFQVLTLNGGSYRVLSRILLNGVEVAGSLSQIYRQTGLPANLQSMRFENLNNNRQMLTPNEVYAVEVCVENFGPGNITVSQVQAYLRVATYPI